jgi:phosphatidate cytidylyltransferase
MKNRTISSIVIIAIALALVIFSSYIVFPIGLSVLALFAVFEVIRVIGVNKKLVITIPAYLMAIAFPILSYFTDKATLLYLLLALAAAMFVYLFWLLAISIFSKGKIGFPCVSEVFVSVLYVVVSVSSLSLLRYLDRGIGVFFVVLVFVIAWVCDTSAFAVGVLLGKHKLIPEISPKKTVEGAIGGIVFTFIACLVYGFGLDLILQDISVKYLVIGLCGALLPVVSQLGDLIASLIKREHGVKDYGTILPGHGGLMDRFDSVMSVSPILLIICLIFPPFSI